jgi:hypothetical protein
LIGEFSKQDLVWAAAIANQDGMSLMATELAGDQPVEIVLVEGKPVERQGMIVVRKLNPPSE